ncbi:MAG: hypothetical protein KC503_41650 [Myxococcales bacterium]|nr:hypothetical protein [Myxococcales bacterium]
MGLLRYLVQGFGWRLGEEAAQETINKLREDERAEAQRRQQATDPRVIRRAERQAAREAKRAAKQAAKAQRERERRIEDELAALKKKADQ